MNRPETSTRALPTFATVCLGSLLILLTPLPAAAYIDPISGSVILQVIAAALLAGLLSFKRAWSWVGSRFREVLGRRTEE